MRQFGQGGVRHRLTAEGIGLVTRQSRSESLNQIYFFFIVTHLHTEREENEEREMES